MAPILYLCIYRGIHWLVENPEQSLVLTLIYPEFTHAAANRARQYNVLIPLHSSMNGKKTWIPCAPLHIHFGVLKTEKNKLSIVQLLESYDRILPIVSPILHPLNSDLVSSTSSRTPHAPWDLWVQNVSWNVWSKDMETCPLGFFRSLCTTTGQACQCNVHGKGYVNEGL